MAYYEGEMFMKMNCFAAAMAVLFSGGVCAQASSTSSVVLYGVANMGVEYLTNAQGTDKGLTRLQSGNLSGSRFGLTGEENIGNGVKGIFTLEAGFDLATGASGQNKRLFGRQAFAGLASPAGQLTLGRQYTSIHDLLLDYDPMAFANYSLLSQDPAIGGRADKSIKYSGTFDGVTLTAFYSFGRDTSVRGMQGDQTTDRKQGRQWGTSLNYAVGPIGIGAAYDAVNGAGADDFGVYDVLPGGSSAAVTGINSWLTKLAAGTAATNSNNTARRFAVAGSYNFGPAKAFLGYRNLKSEFNLSAADTGTSAISNYVYRSNTYWGGATWQATPETALTAVVYYSKNKDMPKTISYVLSADYSLSKRTDVYTNLTYVDNNKKNGIASTVSANPSERTLAGKDQFGAQVGIRHRF